MAFPGRNDTLVRAMLSALLALVSVGLLTLIERVIPYSPLRDRITDFASAPAFLIARLFYPEGVHTGAGSPHWGLVFLGADVGVYWVGWFIALLVRFRMSRRQVTPA